MTKTCLKCNAILPANSLGGQCLRCLLELGLLDGLISEGASGLGFEKIGDWIGPYRLVEILGEGGYGKVYLAEQEFPVRRRVALKVIKVGMDTAQVIARFEAERQALALMDHPNIAKVLDAGATDSGRPFFVMELVSGKRITEYCDSRQLPVQNRLTLFTKVCEAVQHAHHKGIIHRDLKPSNVLVAETESGPIPKVIDFGIAKATGGERLTDRTLFTAFEQFIGTPAYMSPEQAAMSGTDIDTRSDIYSLGVLLYELLTGKMPFEPKRLFDAGLDEIRRIIREEEPPKPSTKLTEQLVAADMSALKSEGDVDNKVRADSHRLLRESVRQIRGDLDWIVMKALEKDRARRYETANDFALDLFRHLNNEPVVARPPSNAYRFQKMVRRNKLIFGAIAAVTVSLITGLVVSTLMFFNERAARQRADIAEQEQSRLREMAELRAYSSDMNLAAQSVQTLGSLNGLANLLDTWRNPTPDLRGWEWYYLNGFLHHDELTVEGDPKGMRAFCWSTDGERFATGGDSGTISIWDAKDGRKLAAFDGGAPIVCIAWHPQKEQLVSATTYGTVAIWDVSSGAAIRSWKPHQGTMRSVAWNSDGRHLATGGYNDKTVAIWDIETGEELLRMSSTGVVQTVAWSRDDTMLATSGGTPSEVWDASTGKQLQTLLPAAFAALDWSPDGRFLALGGYDSQIRIWEVGTWKVAAEYFGHGGAVQVLKWSSDGKTIISTGRDDGAIKVWEPLTGKLLQHYRGHRQGIHALEWHPGGKKIGSSSLDGTAKIWDADAGDASQIRLANDASICSATWSHDGKQLAVGDKQGQVQVWGGANKIPRKFFPGRAWVWNAAWHPDGQQIASGTGKGFIEIWDATAGIMTASIPAFDGATRTVRWNPQGTMLAAGGSGPLKIWDATGQNLLASVDLLFSPCSMLDWSPDGALIACAAGKTLRIVDVATRQISQSLAGHRDVVRCVAWSSDGKFLTSGGEDTVGIIWEAKSGSLVRKLSGHSASIYSVAWSPDGQRIATGNWDCTVKIWNANTGQELCSIKTGETPIMAVAWHPDGHRILAGDLAGALYIHDSSPGLSKNRRAENTPGQLGIGR